MNDKIEWVMVPREPTPEMLDSCAFNRTWEEMRTWWAHMLAAAPKPEAQAAWKVLQIGNYGAAYDSPNARRAFTYAHQPGNVLASRLGSAATAAVAASAGDSIDRGLSLLKSLQDEGFGVFQVDVAALSTPASHDAQQPSEPVGIAELEDLAARHYEAARAAGATHEQALHEGIERALAQQPAVVGDFDEWYASYDGIGGPKNPEQLARDAWERAAALTSAATPGYEGHLCGGLGFIPGPEGTGTEFDAQCPDCAATPGYGPKPAVVGDGVDLQQFRQAVVHWYADADNANTNPEWARGEAERLLAIIDTQAALTPAATPGEPEEYEFEVFQGGAWQAGGSAPDFTTAQAEANHYAMMYGQDGPEVEVKFYARREVTPAQKEGNGNG